MNAAALLSLVTAANGQSAATGKSGGQAGTNTANAFSELIAQLGGAQSAKATPGNALNQIDFRRALREVTADFEGGVAGFLKTLRSEAAEGDGLSSEVADALQALIKQLESSQSDNAYATDPIPASGEPGDVIQPPIAPGTPPRDNQPPIAPGTPNDLSRPSIAAGEADPSQTPPVQLPTAREQTGLFGGTRGAVSPPGPSVDTLNRLEALMTSDRGDNADMIIAMAINRLPSGTGLDALKDTAQAVEAAHRRFDVPQNNWPDAINELIWRKHTAPFTPDPSLLPDGKPPAYLQSASVVGGKPSEFIVIPQNTGHHAAAKGLPFAASAPQAGGGSLAPQSAEAALVAPLVQQGAPKALKTASEIASGGKPSASGAAASSAGAASSAVNLQSATAPQTAQAAAPQTAQLPTAAPTPQDIAVRVDPFSGETDLDGEFLNRQVDALRADRATQAGQASRSGGPQPHIDAQAVARMAQVIAGRAREGARAFEIRMDPPELGKVDVRLEIGADKKVQALMLAEKPETLADLERAARALERALNEAGLEMKRGGLSFGLREDGAGSRGRGDEGDASHSGDAVTKNSSAPDEPAIMASADPSEREIFGFAARAAARVSVSV